MIVKVAESESSDTTTEAVAPDREELLFASLIVCETLVTVGSRIVPVAEELVTFETPRAKAESSGVVTDNTNSLPRRNQSSLCLVLVWSRDQGCQTALPQVTKMSPG